MKEQNLPSAHIVNVFESKVDKNKKGSIIQETKLFCILLKGGNEMFCPKCGKINPDDNQVCSGCGAALAEEKSLPSTNKKGKVLKIALTVIAIIVVICVVALIMNGCGSTPPPEDKLTF